MLNEETLLETVRLLRSLADDSRVQLVVLPALLQQVEDALKAYSDAAQAVVDSIAAFGDCPADVIADMKEKYTELADVWAAIGRVVEVHNDNQ